MTDDPPMKSESPTTPRWVKVFGIVGIILVVLVVILHLTGLAPHDHSR
jgi:hypothetical protein